MKKNTPPTTEKELNEHVIAHLMGAVGLGGIIISATKSTDNLESALQPFAESIIKTTKEFLLNNASEFLKEVSK